MMTINEVRKFLEPLMPQYVSVAFLRDTLHFSRSTLYNAHRRRVLGSVSRGVHSREQVCQWLCQEPWYLTKLLEQDFIKTHKAETAKETAAE